MGSRMLKRWLHMPVRDTAVLVERQQTIGALQERYTELQPVLRQVGDLERILARLALRTARPRDLSPHASCPAAAASAARAAGRR
jgi:DNA mismatch repair protein MutS